jgi:succinylarginine dihydrolase
MLRRAFAKQCGTELCAIEIPSAQLPLAEAVRTYLFNSQLVSLPDHGIALVVPSECMASAPVQEIIQPWVADRSNPIREIISFDLRQSMQNGGGPACLRQRIVLTDAQRNAVTARVFLDDSLYDDLVAWVNRHYRDSITAADLADPQLLSECRDALDDLTSILQLDSLYAFQQ